MDLREKSTQLLLEAELYERTAQAREAILARRQDTKTPRAHTVPIVGAMATAQGETERRRKIALSQIESTHPFVREVLSKYPSVSAWADLHGYTVKAVRSWYLSGSSARSIPPEAAELIEREFPSLPATEETWRNGIQHRRRVG